MTKRTTIYLSEEYKEQLENMAKLTDKNQSEIIRLALDEFMFSDDYSKLKDIKIRKQKMKGGSAHV